jgi:hypothetical protein
VAATCLCAAAWDPKEPGTTPSGCQQTPTCVLLSSASTDAETGLAHTTLGGTLVALSIPKDTRDAILADVGQDPVKICVQTASDATFPQCSQALIDRAPDENSKAVGECFAITLRNRITNTRLATDNLGTHAILISVEANLSPDDDLVLFNENDNADWVPTQCQSLGIEGENEETETVDATFCDFIPFRSVFQVFSFPETTKTFFFETFSPGFGVFKNVRTGQEGSAPYFDVPDEGNPLSEGALAGWRTDNLGKLPLDDPIETPAAIIQPSLREFTTGPVDYSLLVTNLDFKFDDNLPRTITLSFDHVFQTSGGSVATVELADENGDWGVLIKFTESTDDNPTPEQVEMDISSVTFGKTNLALRFRFVGEFFFWIVDNVRLEATL